jgi:hypothetical protein
MQTGAVTLFINALAEPVSKSSVTAADDLNIKCLLKNFKQTESV